MNKSQVLTKENLAENELKSSDYLKDLPSNHLDELALVASQICNTSIAYISILDKEEIHLKSKTGLSTKKLQVEKSFCKYAIESSLEIFEIKDAKKDARFAENELVIDEPNIRFYVGIPLVDSDNKTFGTLCVADQIPRKLTPEQSIALKAIAKVVVQQIDNWKKNQLLKDKLTIREGRLKDSSSKYYELYHEAPDMMISVHPKTKKIVECNLTASRRLGVKIEDLIGQNIFNIFHEDAIEDAKKVLDDFLKNGFVTDQRLILKANNGNKIFISINIKAIKNDQGEIIYSNSILRDINQLVNVENKLRTINKSLEAEINKTKSFLQKVTSIAPSVIYVFDQEKMINEYTNREIGNVLGYSSDEIKAMGSQMINTICHPEDINTVFNHFSKIKQLENDETISVEYRMKHKNGHYNYLLSVDTVFERNLNNEVTKHIGVATNITPIKQDHLKLAEQSKLLQTQNEDLKQFAYVAMHDIKEPITSLEGHFNFLKSHFTTTDSEVNESVGFIEEEIKTFKTTIKSLNSAIKIRESEINREKVNVNTLINEVADKYKYLLEKNKGEFEINLSKTSHVIGSKIYINSILTNLISNAIKYSDPERKPLISIITTVNNECLSISIKDNGLGIDLTLQKDKIFKMFNRFHEHNEGTGMGLYMAKSMVEKMGGKIKIDSKVNRGTKLTIELKISE